MRTLVAALLALALVVASAMTHVHAQGGGSEDCAVCVLRHTAPPAAEVPDVAPIVHVTDEASCAPGVPPVTGAPLGAVPGQSPPAGA